MKKNKMCDFADEANYSKNEKIVINEENYRGLKIKNIEVLEDKNFFHKKGNYLSF